MACVNLACCAASAMAVAACYAPAVRDCTVSCASASDCASSQICGSDGLCAAPSIAGDCRAAMADAGARDAARDAGDAADPDAPPLDAATTVVLHVEILGAGSVLVEGVGACSSKDPQNGDCRYDIVPQVERIADAIAIKSDQRFTMWVSTTCAGQDARCTFTPVADTSIIARFEHTAMHDVAP